MPGGKRKLKQLFTSQMQMGANGTAVSQILAGSVAFTGGVWPGGGDTVTGSPVTVEVTISNLAEGDVILGSVSAISACTDFRGEILAGTGQASLILRYAGSGASVDPYTGTLRYIAFTPA